MEVVTAGFWTVGSLVIFVLRGPPLGDGVDLPTSNPRLGALLMIFGAAGVSVLLIWLNGVLEKRHPYPTQARRPAWVPPVAVDELDEPQEYWSPEPILAWRIWSWDGRVLHGFRTSWKESHLDAECATCPEPPDWAHSCGIYATKHLARLGINRRDRATVLGQVELSGLVIEHDLGYRASRARIVRLWAKKRRTARAIALRYPDVDVRAGLHRLGREVAR